MSESSPAELPITKANSVFMAFPAYGGLIHAPFAMSLMSAMQGESVIGALEVLNGDSLVSRARNKLVMMFLNGKKLKNDKGEDIHVKHDWLMFIDTDLIFEPSDIRKLWELAERRGPNVYCGTYPIKQLKPKIVFNQLEGAKPDAEGVVEVRESGTGFMLIHRQVFEKMIEKFSDEMRYEADSGATSVARAIEYDFFTVGVRTDPVYKYKRYLSEDWYFCQRWREIGGKVLLHTGIQCKHIGQFTYPGDPKDVIEAADIYRGALEVAKKLKEQQTVGSIVPPANYGPVANAA